MSSTKTLSPSKITGPFPLSASAGSSQLNGPSPAEKLLPRAPQYTLRGTLPNTPLAVSVISALLGGVAVGSLVLAAQPLFRLLGSASWTWARSRLGLYLFANGVFHLAEFWTTAGWNVHKLSVDAFLLNNTRSHHYANLAGLAEYLISSTFFPQKFDSWFCSAPTVAAIFTLLAAAQAIRAFAMIQAGSSFSHVVKDVKLDDHTLVTNGIYAYTRHPSYVGFFYWAVLTQLLLGNIFSTLAFIHVLRRFFVHRILVEEHNLIRFFGDEYIQYRKRVGTGLPFQTS